MTAICIQQYNIYDTGEALNFPFNQSTFPWVNHTSLSSYTLIMGDHLYLNLFSYIHVIVGRYQHAIYHRIKINENESVQSWFLFKKVFKFGRHFEKNRMRFNYYSFIGHITNQRAQSVIGTRNHQGRKPLWKSQWYLINFDKMMIS